jgi:hypothetical protein
MCRCGYGWWLTALLTSSSKQERCVDSATFARHEPFLVECYLSSGSALLDRSELSPLPDHFSPFDLFLYFPLCNALTASGVPRHDPSSQRILHGQLPQHLPRRRTTCERVIDQQVLRYEQTLHRYSLHGGSVHPSIIVLLIDCRRSRDYFMIECNPLPPPLSLDTSLTSYPSFSPYPPSL